MPSLGHYGRNKRRGHRGEMHARIRGLLRQGMSNKEIEHEVGLSKKGVRYHIEQIYKEYGLYSGIDHRRLIVKLLNDKGGK